MAVALNLSVRGIRGTQFCEPRHDCNSVTVPYSTLVNFGTGDWFVINLRTLYNTALIWSFYDSEIYLFNSHISFSSRRMDWNDEEWADMLLKTGIMTPHWNEKSQVVLISEWIVHFYSVVCKKTKHVKSLYQKKKNCAITNWKWHKRNTLQLKHVRITVDVQYKVMSDLHNWSI